MPEKSRKEYVAINKFLPRIGSLCWTDIDGVRYDVKIIAETATGYKVCKTMIGGDGDIIEGEQTAEQLYVWNPDVDCAWNGV